MPVGNTPERGRGHVLRSLRLPSICWPVRPSRSHHNQGLVPLQYVHEGPKIGKWQRSAPRYSAPAPAYVTPAPAPCADDPGSSIGTTAGDCDCMGSPVAERR